MDKPVVWLHGEVKTPPWSRFARVQAGVLLRRYDQVARDGGENDAQSQEGSA